MTNDIPRGRRFSHVYVSDSEPLKDIEKARFRISKLAEEACPSGTVSSRYRTHNYEKDAQERLEHELGFIFASKASTGTLHKRWDWFFARISLMDFLDTITIITEFLREEELNDEDFVIGARRVFKEENLSYHIDDLGGVHPLIDAAFTATKQSAIVALQGDRYVATVASVELIDDNLIQDPPNYIGAIRAVFGPNENLFKMMYGVPRLDAKTAGDKLGPIQQSLYEGHPTLQAVSSKMLEAFKDWINAAHFYRHEQGVSTPNQPSEEVAIMMISQGLSYVRWLAQVDRKRL